MEGGGPNTFDRSMAAAAATSRSSLITGGLLLAFVGLSYSSVIRRSSSGKEFLEEFEREIAEESAKQAQQHGGSR